MPFRENGNARALRSSGPREGAKMTSGSDTKSQSSPPGKGLVKVSVIQTNHFQIGVGNEVSKGHDLCTDSKHRKM